MDQKSPPQLARDTAHLLDLRSTLAWLKERGDLIETDKEVDPDLEAATITYLVGSEKSPALLFENIKGHPGHRALYNMIGCNLSRFCLMIGEKPVDHPLGGGEGKTSGGRHPVSPWGLPTKGYKTRNRKTTDKLIVQRRQK